jgi:hypothetical protein
LVGEFAAAGSGSDVVGPPSSSRECSDAVEANDNVASPGGAAAADESIEASVATTAEAMSDSAFILLNEKSLEAFSKEKGESPRQCGDADVDGNIGGRLLLRCILK